MNDRLKFRTWDKEIKKFLEPVTRDELCDTWISIDNTGVYQVERNNETDETFFTDITNDVEVNFCTGLKDRNGKLIYEGDIVEFTHTTNIKCIGVIKFLKEDAMFVVVYKNPRSNKEDWDFMSKFTLNVIGNIYTTPELLEGKE